MEKSCFGRKNSLSKLWSYETAFPIWKTTRSWVWVWIGWMVHSEAWEAPGSQVKKGLHPLCVGNPSMELILEGIRMWRIKAQVIKSERLWIIDSPFTRCPDYGSRNDTGLCLNPPNSTYHALPASVFLSLKREWYLPSELNWRDNDEVCKSVWQVVKAQ